MNKLAIAVLLVSVSSSCSNNHVKTDTFSDKYENEIREVEGNFLNAYKEKNSRGYLKYIADHTSFVSVNTQSCDKGIAKKYWSSADNFDDGLAWTVSGVHVLDIGGQLIAEISYFKTRNASTEREGPFKATWVKVERKRWQLVVDWGGRICPN